MAAWAATAAASPGPPPDADQPPSGTSGAPDSSSAPAYPTTQPAPAPRPAGVVVGALAAGILAIGIVFLAGVLLVRRRRRRAEGQIGESVEQERQQQQQQTTAYQGPFSPTVSTVTSSDYPASPYANIGTYPCQWVYHYQTRVPNPDPTARTIVHPSQGIMLGDMGARY